jgi:hypothetical protein
VRSLHFTLFGYFACSATQLDVAVPLPPVCCVLALMYVSCPVGKSWPCWPPFLGMSHREVGHGLVRCMIARDAYTLRYRSMAVSHVFSAGPGAAGRPGFEYVGENSPIVCLLSKQAALLLNMHGVTVGCIGKVHGWHCCTLQGECHEQLYAPSPAAACCSCMCPRGGALVRLNW